MATVFLAGGAGYIGSHAVHQLVEKGEEVVIVDTLQTGHRDALNPKAKFYEAAFNKVLGRNGFNEVFSFNEIDIEDELKRANIEGMQVRDGIRTVNEVRKDYGWDPVDWGDYPINNNNLDVLTEDLGMKSLENGRRYKNNLYKSGLLENWMF